MTGNQVVFADVKEFIHMARILLVGDWNEDPGLIGLIIISASSQVAFGDQ